MPPRAEGLRREPVTERDCTMTEKNTEQRRHPRFRSLQLSWVCLDENERVVKQGMGRTLNLSLSGILLETYFPIAAAHTVLLSIGLEDEVVDLRGRAVHLRTQKQGVYEVGIEFLDPSAESRAILERFLARLGAA